MSDDIAVPGSDAPAIDLKPGDVISYSAGSTQTGPMGFRVVQPRPGLLGSAAKRWPDLLEALAGRTPLLVNAYPATVGAMSTGVSIDTYLSPRVMTRALQLAAKAGMPAIVCAQPLLLADMLLQHVQADRPLPDTLLLLVGGYVMPRSLARMLRALLAPHGSRVLLVQGYGAAEVDAGCMMARERDEAGRLVYYPRDDVEPHLDGEALRLTLRGPDGAVVIDRFATGDCAARLPGGGYALWNHARLHPVVHEALESWSNADWQRRTGYVRREDQTVWIQLRRGEQPEQAHELDHWEFGRRHGFSWLDKPYWR